MIGSAMDEPMRTGFENESIHAIDQRLEGIFGEMNSNNFLHDLHTARISPQVIAKEAPSLVSVMASTLIMLIEMRRRDIVGLDQSLGEDNDA